MKSHCLQLPILLVQCGMLLERTMSTMVLATASKEPDSKVIFLCRNVILYSLPFFYFSQYLVPCIVSLFGSLCLHVQEA